MDYILNEFTITNIALYWQLLLFASIFFAFVVWFFKK